MSVGMCGRSWRLSTSVEEIKNTSLTFLHTDPDRNLNSNYRNMLLISSVFIFILSYCKYCQSYIVFSHIFCTIIQNITKKLINQKHDFFYSKCNHYSTWLFIIFAGESNGNFIRQNQPSVVLTEGSSTSLSCSYDGSAYSLHWYRQKPGSKPEFLLLIVRSTKTVVPASPPHPHMSITLHDNKRVDLEMSSAAVSDSSMYYCALQHTVTGKQTILYLLVICLLHSHISLP